MEVQTRSLRLFVELYIIESNLSGNTNISENEKDEIIRQTRVLTRTSSNFGTIYFDKFKISLTKLCVICDEKLMKSKIWSLMDRVNEQRRANITERNFPAGLEGKNELQRITSFKLFLNQEFELSHNDTICITLLNNEVVQILERGERTKQELETDVVNIEPVDVCMRKESPERTEVIVVEEEENGEGEKEEIKEVNEAESECRSEEKPILTQNLEKDEKNIDIEKENPEEQKEVIDDRKASTCNDIISSGNENQQMSRSQRKKQKKKNKGKEKAALPETQNQSINNTQSSTIPQSQLQNKLQPIQNQNKGKATGQSKIQDFMSKQTLSGSNKQKKLNKRDQKLQNKKDEIEVSNDWQNTLNNLLLGSKDMNSKFASHSIPNEVEHLKPEKARKESLKVNREEEKEERES